MELSGRDENAHPLAERPLSVSAVFEESEGIAAARGLARSLLSDAQRTHGLSVSGRAMGAVQLVVSELVTNARKYAPGPCLLTLEIINEVVEVTVWDSEPRLPVAQEADPARVGQHGLEIVMALCRSFEMHREPVGKRIKAAVALADDSVGDVADRQAL
ncbi:ATP-binding protein [Streptomyces mexicanus]|jgi:anti-sigma regulatory factor (Ser/Thr protein kinase)|uniref:ATP-binding protein n=1 Tax=Streptomyces mexicanus TaxID=178566 RepID=UPI0031E55D88